MEKRKLGQSDLQVSPICLGTMTFGQQNTQADAHRQLDFARERGVNFIDTAEMYPVPPCADTCFITESMVGNWLQRVPRDEVILATKVTGAGRPMKWIRGGALPFDRANIHQAINDSLQRLQTDYVDLYQLHWPERNTPMFGDYLFDPEKERTFTPPHETLEALAELVEQGKIRYIGLSNEWPWGLMKFLEAAKEYNLPRIVSVQNAHNLLNRTFESALLECCYREDIALLAYSPLAFGLLSGKYQQNPSAPGRVNEFAGFAQRYQKPMVAEAVAAYVKLAEKYSITPTQLALGYVYSRRFVTSTIIGVTNMAQLEENVDAWATEFSAELEQELADLRLQYFNPAP